MNKVNILYHKTSIGELILGSYEGKLCLLDFRYRKMRQVIDNRIKSVLEAEFIFQDDEVLKLTRQQLDEYLAGRRIGFDVPLLLIGSDFQKAVWNALIQVTYGKTATYLDLARAVGNEKAVRAVAGANGANAIAIIIPCHRILGSNGELTGGRYAVARHVGELDDISHTIWGIIRHWLPASGEKMRKAPILFHYTNLAEGVTEQRLETDVYVPLA